MLSFIHLRSLCAYGSDHHLATISKLGQPGFQPGQPATATASSWRLDHRLAATTPRYSWPGHPAVNISSSLLPPHREAPCQVSKQSSPFCPVFPPTVLLVGDSIVRNIRFPNTVTHCFPGDTVPVLDKLSGLLQSLPSSTTRVAVHMGTKQK